MVNSIREHNCYNWVWLNYVSIKNAENCVLGKYFTSNNYFNVLINMKYKAYIVEGYIIGDITPTDNSLPKYPHKYDITHNIINYVDPTLCDWN